MTKLTDNELNKRIHEIMGLCWHNNIDQRNVPMCNDEGKVCGGYLEYYCVDCDEHIRGFSSPIVVRYNFTGDWKTSAYEFGMMFEFMQKHERWEKFRNYVWDCRIGHGDWANDLTDADSVPISIISPRPFAVAMVSFFDKEAKP